MKMKTEFDRERDEEVSRTEMDFNCNLNHQRIIVNIPTITNAIKVYAQLMEVLNSRAATQL